MKKTGGWLDFFGVPISYGYFDPEDPKGTADMIDKWVQGKVKNGKEKRKKKT